MPDTMTAKEFLEHIGCEITYENGSYTSIFYRAYKYAFDKKYYACMALSMMCVHHMTPAVLAAARDRDAGRPMVRVPELEE